MEGQAAAQSAFTLVEIMIAVTLMSVIVIGLMAMFTQTQRAFRLGMNQSDVLETGRVATEMIVREMEQVTPSYNNYTNVNSTNFFAALPNYPVAPLPLPGGAVRTNVFHDLYFQTHENMTWTGIGYYVRTGPSYYSGTGPVGTLYRVQNSAADWQFTSGAVPLSWLYFYGTNNVSKLIEGVVHFRVRAYDNKGEWITPPRNASGVPYWWANTTNNLYNIRADLSVPKAPGEVSYYTFSSNAVPAFVELEIGILEQQTYERYKAIPVYEAQTNFLAKHAGNIHIFRQRVPIRNVDVTAYQ